MKTLSIVAKYKEDVSWITSYNSEFVVYNKDSSCSQFQNNYSNIGRESESYIRFILNNYKILDQYDRILFLQGNPFDHMDTEQLKSVLPDSNGIVSRKSHLPIPLTFRWSYIYREYCLITLKHDRSIYKFETPENPMYHWNMTLEMNKMLYLPKFEYLIQHTGAQWIIPPKYILNKSYDWWENAHKIHFIENDLALYAPYVFERLWENIWFHSDLEN